MSVWVVARITPSGEDYEYLHAFDYTDNGRLRLGSLEWTNVQTRAHRFMDRNEAARAAEVVDHSARPRRIIARRASNDAIKLTVENARLRGENARLRSVLEETNDALACQSCAEDLKCYSGHGDMHAKIRAVLDGSTQSEGPAK